MKPETILRSDLLDILFENRNKTYGAYDLRRHYNERLRWSLLAMLGIALSLGWLFSRNPRPVDINYIIPVGDTMILTEIKPPVEPLPPVAPPPPPPPGNPTQVATIENTAPLITAEADSTEVPETDVMVNAQISNYTSDGTATTGDAPVQQGTGTQPAVPEPVVEPPVDEPLTYASVMPSFPGGDGALQRWLSRNLRPNDDQQPGEKIKVVVRFVVGVNGKIDRIELVQKGGEPYDNEVLRVIHKMPDWKPGSQGGRPVPVWFNIPVIFQAGED
ncbi:TonB family protein [Flavihumibacter petaseus]|uniref:TonB C-terminal domain-containing protein n=1 Tax=Flavihumibacter petaseus NBRC 106054 TaxID=1220578 RepID=A0A0E9MVI7_9BACT|nr:TonB family protein [Flavihumibacter petaseus]GAO41498.1 hypothetical protein FPE01S_01_05120 [Flavihumibacter petaseus NBRC 106054]